jgi:hypothetical protein
VGSRRHLVRIEDPEHADIRLLFATPSTVDRLCGEVGAPDPRRVLVLDRHEGRFAVINSWRYAFGAAGFDDRDEYRRYVVNHEVGHGLGFGHVGCPGPGAAGARHDAAERLARRLRRERLALPGRLIGSYDSAAGVHRRAVLGDRLAALDGDERLP